MFAQRIGLARGSGAARLGYGLAVALVISVTAGGAYAFSGASEGASSVGSAQASSASAQTQESQAHGADNSEARLQVVATTPIMADLVSQVAGDDAQVTTLIPPGKDPHDFEPTLRTVREVAYADLAFANGLLLEPPALAETLRESTAGEVVDVADLAPSYGAELIPLVENIALDAVWLGLRVQGAQEANSVTFTMTDAQGPGDVSAYIVSTFGTPEPIFPSDSGIDLPANAHTHVSWAFSEPGMYQLTFAATGQSGSEATEEQTITVAVGVNPEEGAHVIDSGHVDITADLADGSISLRDHDANFDPNTTVLAIPSSTLQPIPPDPAYRFLGRPGQETYLLPQAVLGKHLHGEIDPHLWHNTRNARAYVEVIAEQMATADPSNGHRYQQRAAEYNQQLRLVDDELRATYDAIPEHRRHLVTTHHGYTYLEQGYGINIAGFVTPNPSVEPSPRDVIALQRTLENLDIPAVFVEPNAAASTSTLEETARRAGAEVCTIYGDSLDERVPTYLDLMRFNAHEINRCLSP